MKSSLALIGFMGTGKTAVGRVLAQKLCREFIELDTVVEQIAGKNIPAIFNQDGEIRFRELEIEAVKQVAPRRNVVIACGGGVVLNWINIERLKQECTIVLLTAGPAAVLRRVTVDRSIRPLLQMPSRESIADMLAFRGPFYERAADITVNTTWLTIEGVANHIIEQVRKEP